MQLVLTVAYRHEEADELPSTDTCRDILSRLVSTATNRGLLTGDQDFVVDSYSTEIVELDPAHEKPDSHWNGAIDALHSQGHDSQTIRDMIVNMGCDPDDADAHCGI